MQKGTINRILLLGTAFALGTAGVSALAQTTTRPVNPGMTQPNHQATTQPNHQAVKNAAQSNPSCQHIVQECEKLGFIVGEWKQDNGVWKDCFDPVVHGGNPTREGKPIHVPVSQNDLQSCRAAVEQHHQKAMNAPPKQ